MKAQHSENKDHGIWSHHSMGNRWGNLETVSDFILGGSKITANSDCSHEIKSQLVAPWKESYDQPRYHIQKQRHYFASKGPSSQGLVSPVFMYGCESWTIKKAEC